MLSSTTLKPNTYRVQMWMTSGTVSCSVWIQNMYQTGRYKKVEISMSQQWRQEGGSRVITPPNLTSTPDVGEWLVSCPGRFTTWKEPYYPLNRGLGEPQRRSTPFGEDKNVMTLPGLESRIVQFAILTVVFNTYRLLLLLLSSSSSSS